MPVRRRFAFFSRAKHDVSDRFYPSREIGNKTFQSVVGKVWLRRLGTLRPFQARAAGGHASVAVQHHPPRRRLALPLPQAYWHPFQQQVFSTLSES